MIGNPTTEQFLLCSDRFVERLMASPELVNVFVKDSDVFAQIEDEMPQKIGRITSPVFLIKAWRINDDKTISIFGATTVLGCSPKPVAIRDCPS